MTLVIMVMATAAVMGYAMLASNSLQGQVSHSGVQSIAAANLAESGVNLAMYYLQKPAKAPSLTNGYWPGQSNITFGKAMSGSASVTVSKVANLTNTYDVVSIGRAVGNDGSTVTRKITARVKVNYGYSVSYAAGFNSSVQIPSMSTINGDLKTGGSLRMGLLSTINGTVYYVTDLLGSLLPSLSQKTSDAGEEFAPSNPKDYKTYTYQGKTYAAVEIAASSLSNTTLGPTPTNPGGVYYRNGSLQLNGNVTINGSLQVGSGLTIKGSNNQISPRDGLPGLVVKNDLKMDGANRSITINGLTWVGSGITQNASIGASITINGSFLSPASTPIATNYLGTVNITYDKTKATVSDFSESGGTPKNVSVVSWN